MARIKNILGIKFDRLTAVELVGKDKGGQALWKFVCDCGVEKVI